MRLSPLLLLAACACAVDVIEARPRRVGTVAGVGVIDPGGGHLRYPLQGAELAIRKRRERAFKKMAAHCGGKDRFRIKKEYTADDAMTPFPETDLDADKLVDTGHYRIDRYRHITFKCAEPRK